MKKKPLTNEEIWNTDFAEASRKAFLRKVATSKPARTQNRRHGFTASVGQPIDLSADRRSVKAQLAGRGDFRAHWWNLNCLLHRVLFPDATLEQGMISFHRKHHAITLFSLQFLHDSREVKQAIHRRGLWAGACCAFNQALAKEHP